MLDQYFAGQSTKVSLYFLDYTFTKVADYNIDNGDWSALKKVLKECKYDGGTRYSQIRLEQSSTVLFFTDGISSLSSNSLQIPAGTVLHTISSVATADHSYLNYIASLNSGVYVNLKSLTASQGVHLLKTKSIRFQGVEENVLVNEIYPLKGTLVSKNSFSISGVSLKESNEIVLLFGPTPDNIVKKVHHTISTEDSSTAVVDIEKIWAVKKIESMEYDYAKNKEQIELLGRKYSIVTKGTSLIVLEAVADYIKYGITPPQ